MHICIDFVAGADGRRPVTRHGDHTDPPRTWRLLPDERLGEPVGNKLNDNLIRELVLSTTPVPPDLRLLALG